MIRLVLLVISSLMALAALLSAVFSVLGDVASSQSFMTIFWNILSQSGWGLAYAILGFAVADLLSPLSAISRATLKSLLAIGILFGGLSAARTAFIMFGMFMPSSISATDGPYRYASFLTTTTIGILANILAIFLLAAFWLRLQKIETEGSF